ncbi:hypothetical protein Y032_0232g3037 [Ancylostoma ceylanicum]|uniref:Neurotransmitter-gated ion-channel ligand-binding domain-containing protein n=1 Tax=Ancylostoma ceylanicum TaxID=53326 RepID=A0A016SGI6_9BILA|nr:hypothetical protein Y032_0232g3037 [Ancylostoma ceylanicum]
MQTEPVACHDTFPDNVIVSCNGDILRVFTLSVLFTCTIKAGKFPFDTQSCSLDFAEYLMDPSETDLSMFIVEDAIFKTVVTLSSLISLLVLTDIMDKSVPKTSDIPNSAKHIWWNITVMTLALCDIRLLTFLKKNDIKFNLPKSGSTNAFTSFQPFLEVLGALLDERIFHLLLFQGLAFLSLVVFEF